MHDHVVAPDTLAEVLNMALKLANLLTVCILDSILSGDAVLLLCLECCGEAGLGVC